MAAKAGIWIDGKKAIIVKLTTSGQDISKVTPATLPSERVSESAAKSKFTPNDFIAEDRRERKRLNDRKKFYSEVLNGVRGIKTLILLGPGDAKNELRKLIMANKHSGRSAELLTTDKMTERQIAAEVRNYFGTDESRQKGIAKVALKSKPSRRTQKTS